MGNKNVSAGILGLIVGAALGYFFSPRSGKENRERLGNWMNDMSNELHDRVNKAQNLTSEKYNEIVDQIAHKYRKMKGIKDTELNDFVSDLKMRWDRVKDRWNTDDYSRAEY